MQLKLVLSALSLVLLCGTVHAQSSRSGLDQIGATADRSSVSSSRSRIKSSMPSIESTDTDSEPSVSALMPSRTLGDEPYSSIEPKGTWIGSMGIFNRALLDRRGSRTRKAGITGARSKKTRL